MGPFCVNSYLHYFIFTKTYYHTVNLSIYCQKPMNYLIRGHYLYVIKIGSSLSGTKRPILVIKYGGLPECRSF